MAYDFAMKRVPAIAAIAVFLVHLIANPHYGYFRDELYFIVCGMHPQWGYVDQPPIVPLLAAVSQLFGHSLILLRAVPALFAAVGIYVTCALVNRVRWRCVCASHRRARIFLRTCPHELRHESRYG
jgi:hypothetical protein